MAKGNSNDAQSSAEKTTPAEETKNAGETTNVNSTSPAADEVSKKNVDASSKPAPAKKETAAADNTPADTNSTAETPLKPLNHGFKVWSKDEAKGVFGDKPEQLLVLATSITKLFHDNSLTSLPKPTFDEVVAFCGIHAKTCNISVEYADVENLTGKITIAEFDKSIVLPANGGLFNFGVDYTKGV